MFDALHGLELVALLPRVLVDVALGKVVKRPEDLRAHHAEDRVQFAEPPLDVGGGQRVDVGAPIGEISKPHALE